MAIIEKLIAKCRFIGRYCKGVFVSTHALPLNMRIRSQVAFNYAEDFLVEGYSGTKASRESFVRGKVDFGTITEFNYLRVLNIFHGGPFLIGSVRGLLCSAIDYVDGCSQTDVPNSSVAIVCKGLLGLAFSVVEVPVYIVASKIIGDFTDMIFMDPLMNCCKEKNQVKKTTAVRRNLTEIYRIGDVPIVGRRDGSVPPLAKSCGSRMLVEPLPLSTADLSASDVPASVRQVLKRQQQKRATLTRSSSQENVLKSLRSAGSASGSSVASVAEREVKISSPTRLPVASDLDELVINASRKPRHKRSRSFDSAELQRYKSLLLQSKHLQVPQIDLPGLVTSIASDSVVVQIKLA